MTIGDIFLTFPRKQIFHANRDNLQEMSDSVFWENISKCCLLKNLLLSVK